MWEHVIWIWMENKEQGSVIGAPDAPLLNNLTSTCGSAAAYSGVEHPSLPNYIAATSGDTWGITDNNNPSVHPLLVPSIYSQLEGVGSTWRDYEENAPKNCPQAGSGDYAVRHDPAPYYTTIAATCALYDINAGTLASGPLASDLAAGTLPTFSFITPNVCNDMHSCPVRAGDDWLRAWLPRILASPAYQAGTTAVFVAWDENEGASGNRVPFLAVAPAIVPGTSATTPFNHYSLLRTTEEMLGLPPLANAATAASMRADLHL
jgi:phospholipase C